MTILKIMSIFLLAGVTGCAASASNVPAADLDFIGKTKADVIRARGEPGRVTNYYLGGALLVYVSDEHPVTAIYPKGPAEHRCETRFSINKLGVVADVSRIGNCHDSR